MFFNNYIAIQAVNKQFGLKNNNLLLVVVGDFARVALMFELLQYYSESGEIPRSLLKLHKLKIAIYVLPNDLFVRLTHTCQLSEIFMGETARESTFLTHFFTGLPLTFKFWKSRLPGCQFWKSRKKNLEVWYFEG